MGEKVIGEQNLDKGVASKKEVEIIDYNYEGEPSSFKGVITSYMFPYYLSLKNGNRGEPLNFLGVNSGIFSIQSTSTNEFFYKNDLLPKDYPKDLSEFGPKGLDKLNGLRKKCFGKGFDFALSEDPIGRM